MILKQKTYYRLQRVVLVLVLVVFVFNLVSSSIFQNFAFATSSTTSTIPALNLLSLEEIAAKLNTDVKKLTIKQIVDEYKKNNIKVSTTELIDSLQTALNNQESTYQISGDSTTVEALMAAGLNTSFVYDTAYDQVQAVYAQVAPFPSIDITLKDMATAKYNNKTSIKDFTISELVKYLLSKDFKVIESQVIAKLNSLATINKGKISGSTKVTELLNPTYFGLTDTQTNKVFADNYYAVVTGPTAPGDEWQSPTGCERGLSNTFCIDQSPVAAAKDIASNANVLLSILASIMILFGAFRIITANGDPKRVSQGREIIFSALLGVAIFVGYYMIVSIINPFINQS